MVTEYTLNARKGAKQLEQGLQKIYQMDSRDPLRYPFRNVQAESHYKPFLKLGTSFYLLRAWNSWSPGDICGYLKMKQYVLPDVELMAILVSQDYYIPHHGLASSILKKALEQFIAQEDDLMYN